MDNITLGSLPKVLLMGLRTSGKSSIRKVVFEKVPPQETTFLPTTTRVETDDIDKDTFVKFQVCDFPGQMDPFDPATRGSLDPNQIFENCGAIVYVMDCEHHLEEAQRRLLDTIIASYDAKSEAHIEVFIHKVDVVEADRKNDLFRKVKRFIDDGIVSRLGKKEASIEKRLNYNLTTIYDHSVFLAFSLVVQNLIKKQMPYIRELITMLKNRSRLQYAFLLDRTSKIYLARDSDVQPEKYELLSDAVELLEDLSSVYSTKATQIRKLKANHGGNDLVGQSQEELLGTLPNSDTVIHLADERILYVKQLGSSLVLAAEIFERDFANRAMIDYNIAVFGKAIAEVFDAAGNMR